MADLAFSANFEQGQLLARRPLSSPIRGGQIELFGGQGLGDPAVQMAWPADQAAIDERRRYGKLLGEPNANPARGGFRLHPALLLDQFAKGALGGGEYRAGRQKHGQRESVAFPLQSWPLVAAAQQFPLVGTTAPARAPISLVVPSQADSWFRSPTFNARIGSLCKLGHGKGDASERNPLR